ncbi:DegT/DnrJ/EryC1/StrS aminotransferase family protein [Tritrichomonas foetus]|uniref:DegT/DnrJ/EryC1/StrS aminotransferase family protein n=1 Tax=Tritrichomonas foetus TaxID=1144522 RepID=A0A1J4J6U5_9EUKA|nr:DegT/DnrJ/EryC1/StrS aminotransferase family protein [Tritrichomonas foetus]|eukprot:OHS93379.1 DegT/DnrJ/EryC1/StrS aminotransferase family protein [Tritrichomonas foetus]
MSVRKVWYAPNMKQAYNEEEIEAVKQCLEDGWLAPGPRTAEFEKQVCAKFGKKFGLFVNSGSSANMLAYISAGISQGVEVITPACTFSTTVAPLVQLGADVKFCDVHPNCYIPTVDQVLTRLSSNTKAIVIPNLLGNKPDWKQLRERLNQMGRSDIILIEDSCDTMTYTEITDIATCSFYASHIITAGGGGGIVMFNDQKQYGKALCIRDWGRAGSNSEEFGERFNHGLIDGIQYDWKFIYCEFGYNFKSSEMNAAFGLVQMKKLPEFERKRASLMQRYLNTLKSNEYASKYYKFPQTVVDEQILWLAFPLACADRTAIIEHLEKNQIQTRVTMAGNILRHPIYAKKFEEEAKIGFPVSDQVMREGFLVGCHHGLTEEDVDRVCAVLIEFAQERLSKQ